MDVKPMYLIRYLLILITYQKMGYMHYYYKIWLINATEDQLKETWYNIYLLPIFRGPLTMLLCQFIPSLYHLWDDRGFRPDSSNWTCIVHRAVLDPSTANNWNIFLHDVCLSLFIIMANLWDVLLSHNFS